MAYLRHPLERALEGIAGCGIENIELASIPGYCEHLAVAALPSAQRVLDVCSGFGLTPVAISAHGDLKDPSDHKHVAACMGLAADIGASVVTTGTGDVVTDEDEARIMRSVAQLAEWGDRLGVTLGLETQNDIVTSGTGAVSLVERIGSRSVRVNLDPANIVYWSGRDAPAETRAMAKFVAHMHVKDHRGGRGDYEFPRLGTGEIDLEEIISLLIGAGFCGVFVIEPEPSRPVPERPASEVNRVRQEPGLAYSEFHDYLGEEDADKVDAELRAALEYLRGVLSSSPAEPSDGVGSDQERDESPVAAKNAMSEKEEQRG